MEYPDVSGTPISYDDNGNMTDHTDKGILEIRYNVLNLPDYVKFDKTYIPRFTGWVGADYHVNTQYLYRADGVKLRKTYTYGSGKANAEVNTVTEYLEGFQYEADNTGSKFIPGLKFVPTAEGYYDFEKNRYIYSYTDHLGNIRLSYYRGADGSAAVLEENNFYPFGLKHEGYNAQPGNASYTYQYNSKELQRETGWNDYWARMYMSDIGRWGVVDPLAETSRRYTPYNYALNNPIRFIDPDGRKAMAPEEFTDFTIGSDSFWWRQGGGRKKVVPFMGGQDFLGEMFALVDAATRRIAEDGVGGSIIGSGPGPKDNTGPGIIQSIGNFLSNLFGGRKSTATGHQVHFSIVDIAFIPEGAVGGSLSTSLQGIGTGLFSTAGLTAGAIFVPTMIGEPEFNWARQFDTPVDIPVTTTDNIPEKTMTLFRGVHSKHPDLSNAYMGMAIPWGGSATAFQHNRGDNNSMFTSWTTSIDMANYSAYRRGPGGVILKQSFPVSRLSFFDRHGENEVQVFGPVTGAQVIKPWDFGTWKPYLK